MAVDYLIYPYEVFVNIWESYHVGIIVALCLVLAVAWIFAATRFFNRMWDTPFSARTRFLNFASVLAHRGGFDADF